MKVVAGWWWAQCTHLRLGWRYYWCVYRYIRGRDPWGEVDGWKYPSRRWGLRQPHGQPLHPGDIAQTEKEHHRQQACSATPENSLWACKAHLVFVHSGQHRDRLPLWGHRLLHKDHSCQVNAWDVQFVRFFLHLGWFSLVDFTRLEKRSVSLFCLYEKCKSTYLWSDLCWFNQPSTWQMAVAETSNSASLKVDESWTESSSSCNIWTVHIINTELFRPNPSVTDSIWIFM